MAAPYDFSVGTVRGRRRAEGAGMATVLGAVMCVRSGLDRARRSCRPQVDRTPLLTGCAETKSWISGIMLLPGCREVTLDSAPLRFRLYIVVGAFPFRGIRNVTCRGSVGGHPASATFAVRKFYSARDQRV